MSTEKLDGSPSRAYQLGYGRVEGRPTVVLRTDGADHRLIDAAPQIDPALTTADLLADWPVWEPVVQTAADAVGPHSRIEVEQWFAPVNPGTLVCVGTNYHDHLREMGTPTPPRYPYAFLKPSVTGVVGSGARVELPAVSEMVDWEAELAVVIGRTPQPGSDPMESVAGYTVMNDLSARDWIRSKPEVGVDWVMQKAYDGFSPIGPYVTPRRFVADPQALAIRCWVNDELRQDSTTAEMIFGVGEIITHLSSIMTLLPGDVIATGTPAGVGFGSRPPRFLGHGDVVVVEIEGLGRLETTMIDTLRRTA